MKLKSIAELRRHFARRPLFYERPCGHIPMRMTSADSPPMKDQTPPNFGDKVMHTR